MTSYNDSHDDKNDVDNDDKQDGNDFHDNDGGVARDGCIDEDYRHNEEEK